MVPYVTITYENTPSTMDRIRIRNKSFRIHNTGELKTLPAAGLRAPPLLLLYRQPSDRPPAAGGGRGPGRADTSPHRPDSRPRHAKAPVGPFLLPVY